MNVRKQLLIAAGLAGSVAAGQHVVSADQVQKHTVASGETLSALASRFNTTVAKLASDNQIRNVDQIYQGQELIIGVANTQAAAQRTTIQTTDNTYQVQAGDTLWTLAREFGLSVEQLAQENKIKDANQIFVGQVLTVNKNAGQTGSQSAKPSVQSASSQTATSEAPASQSASSQTATSEAPASQLASSQTVVSEAPASQLASSQTVVSEAPASQSASSQTATSEAPASQLASSQAATSEAPASQSTSSQTVASEVPASQSASSQTVTSEAPASQSASSQTASSEAPASQSASSQTATSEAPASQLASSQTVASEAPASQLASSQTVASEAPASQSASSQTVTSEAPASQVATPAPVTDQQGQAVQDNNFDDNQAEQQALQTIIMKESGGNVNATNGIYFGIGQLSPTLRARYGGNSTDYQDQLQAMKAYIAARYGTAQAALAHHLQYGWY